MTEFIPSNTSTTEIESLVERHRHAKLAEIALDYNNTLNQSNSNLRITPSKFTSLQLIFVLITRGIFDIPGELTADLIPHPETIIGVLSSSAHTIGQGAAYTEEENYDVIPGIYWLYLNRASLRPYLLGALAIEFISSAQFEGLDNLYEGWKDTDNNMSQIKTCGGELTPIIQSLNPDGLFLLATALHEQPFDVFYGNNSIETFIEIVRDLYPRNATI